jgi:hypothetical protein
LPLAYWELNSSNYPILAILARRYLAIPATSASSERFFSQGALVINKLRNRLNKDTFNIIMCLRSWGTIIEEEEKANKESNNTIEEVEFIY